MMEKWRSIALVLSLYGFLKDIRPSDPFLVQFLSGPCWHNVSAEQINHEVFPVGTYSYGVQLVITFLITDYFRYKPLIVVSALAGFVHYVLLIWGNSLKWVQLSEVFYGTYKATDVAFWSYIYARVDKSCYQKITSYTKSSSQFAKFSAAVGSQVLLYYGLVDYLDLNYVSLTVQLCTTTIALFLPPAPKSIYFNRSAAAPAISSTKDPPTAAVAAATAENGVTKTDSSPTVSSSEDVQHDKLSALQFLWFHVKSAYTNFTVLRFSIWHALSSCVYYQTVLYVQVLWRTIGGKAAVVYWNGAVEAVLTICAAIITFSAGFVPAKLLELPNALAGLSWISFMQGGVLLTSGLTSSLWVAYGAHILYSVLHAFTITLLSAEIAKNICGDSFGLVFGINAMVGSLLQCLLTVTVVKNTTIKGQFAGYAGLCIGIGVIFSVFLLVELKKCWKFLFYVFKMKFSFPKKLALDNNVNNQTA